MILKPREQLDFLTPISVKHGIIENEDLYTFERRERTHLINDKATESGKETTPVISHLIQKAVHRILAGKRLGFVAFEQAEPVFLVE